MTVVLRIGGERLDVDCVLKMVSPSRVERVSRAGEPGRPGGPPARESGITLPLTEAENHEERTFEIVAALDELLPGIQESMRQGAHGEVDYALFVSAMQMRSATVEPAILRTLGELGLRLIVSAYPVQEDPELDDADG